MTCIKVFKSSYEMCKKEIQESTGITQVNAIINSTSGSITSPKTHSNIGNKENMKMLIRLPPGTIQSKRSSSNKSKTPRNLKMSKPIGEDIYGATNSTNALGLMLTNLSERRKSHNIEPPQGKFKSKLLRKASKSPSIKSIKSR